MAPSLLFHSNVITYPSEPDSFLAVVRIPKSASLDSIVITPLGLQPFYYHKSNSNADNGQTPTKPAEIELLFNARYPSTPSVKLVTASTSSSTPTKAPKGWRPNSLHKSTLSYNPYLSIPDKAPSHICSPSLLAIQQFEIGMPLDVSTTLVILRCPFPIITLSLYGYPATTSSAISDYDESSTAGWEAYLRNSSAQPRLHLPSESFENVLHSITSARPNHLDNVTSRGIEDDGQNEEKSLFDDPMSEETIVHPLQQRLDEILENLVHLTESLEKELALHSQDKSDHSSKYTSSTPTSSMPSEVCIELIVLNLIHFLEVLGFSNHQPTSSPGLQPFFTSLHVDVLIHAVFQLLTWSTLAHWDEALAVSARIWIDLIQIPCISDTLISAFTITPNLDPSCYKLFYDLSSWREILHNQGFGRAVSPADQATMVSLSQDLLQTGALCDIDRTSRLRRQVEGEITPNGLFLFIESYLSMGSVCSRLSLSKEGEEYEEMDIELGWLVRWMDRKEWEHIYTHLLTQTSTFSALLRLSTSELSSSSTARHIVNKLLISPVVSTSPCIFNLLHLRLLASSLLPLTLPSPSPSSSSSSSRKRFIASTSAKRLHTVIDCTEYAMSDISFEHLLSRCIRSAQSISSSLDPLTIYQTHLYLLHTLRSFPKFNKRRISSDRLSSRLFWMFYLGLAVEVHEDLKTCFWNGIENLIRTPPFIRLNHSTYRGSSAKVAGEEVGILGALGELAARLLSLIRCFLNVIIHDLPPLPHLQFSASVSGRPEIEHPIETKTMNSTIVRVTWDAISTFVRTELFLSYLTTKRGEVDLTNSEVDQLKGGLNLSKTTSLGVLDRLTFLSHLHEDGSDKTYVDEEERLTLVIRTIINYALGVKDQNARDIVGKVIGGLIPDPPSLSSSVPTLNPSTGWEVWDRILLENSTQLTFLVLVLTSTSPSTQSFHEKLRRFPSLSTKILDFSPSSLSPSLSQEEGVDALTTPVGQVSSTSILEWMFTSPSSKSDTAIDPTSQTTSVTNPGSFSSITSVTPTATTVSATSVPPAVTTTTTSIAPVVGGMASAPIQRTSKTYRQNEFRSSRPSTLVLPSGGPLVVSPGPSGPVVGGGLGIGVIGNGGSVQKINASRAPSKHVDEFELEIELESQRKRTEQGSRETK